MLRFQVETPSYLLLISTLDMGPVFGIILGIILTVDCLFFIFLEWWIPESSLDKVKAHWTRGRFEEVRVMKLSFVFDSLTL